MAKSFLNMPSYPRGLRNNNPGNLRYFENWQGMIGVDNAGFMQFKDLSWGLRALAIDLQSKIRNGLDTIETIIYRYAPPSDNNDTEAYIGKIGSVESSTGWDRSKPLQADAATLSKLMRAIIDVEIGANYAHLVTQQDINEGLAMMGQDNTTGIVGFSFATGLFIFAAALAYDTLKRSRSVRKRA